MSIKLIDLPRLANCLQYTDTSGFWWMKACSTPEEGVYKLIQAPVTCKDYVVDTQYREVTSGNWSMGHMDITDKERHENCVAVISHVNYIKQLMHHLELFLHPLEEKLELEKTQVLPVDKYNNMDKKGLYIITGDNKWNTCGLSWSMYLSIIRAMAFTNTKRTPKTINDLFTYCSANEGRYMQYYVHESEYSKYGKKIFAWIEENLPLFLDGIKLKSYNKYTGYTTAQGHGMTGQFTLTYNLSRHLCTGCEQGLQNYWIKLIKKQFKEEENERTMQSV